MNFDFKFPQSGLSNPDLSKTLSESMDRSNALLSNMRTFSDVIDDQTEELSARIVTPLERHIEAVETIAKSAESQSASAHDIAVSLREQTAALKEQVGVMRDELTLSLQTAYDANRDAKFSKSMAVVSIIISIVAVILQRVQ